MIPPRVLSLIVSLTGSLVNTMLTHESFFLQAFQKPSVLYLTYESYWHNLLMFFLFKTFVHQVRDGAKVICAQSLSTEDSIRQGMDPLICEEFEPEGQTEVSLVEC